MCVLAVAWRQRSDRPLVFAGNRDEYHARPTVALRWWPENGIWAGRDRRAGGTWLALTPQGRFATVTNIREPAPGTPPRSRGELPVLAVECSAEWLAAHVRGHGHDYAGFNLLFGDADGVFVLSNRMAGIQRLRPGVHALSNAALNTPWPKVVAARERMARLLRRDSPPGTDALADVLGDREVAPPARLPATGVPVELERRFSALFVESPEYGTRCTTAFSLDAHGGGDLLERRFRPDGGACGETRVALGPAAAG